MLAIHSYHHQQIQNICSFDGKFIHVHCFIYYFIHFIYFDRSNNIISVKSFDISLNSQTKKKKLVCCASQRKMIQKFDSESANLIDYPVVDLCARPTNTHFSYFSNEKQNQKCFFVFFRSTFAICIQILLLCYSYYTAVAKMQILLETFSRSTLFIKSCNEKIKRKY